MADKQQQPDAAAGAVAKAGANGTDDDASAVKPAANSRQRRSAARSARRHEANNAGDALKRRIAQLGRGDPVTAEDRADAACVAAYSGRLARKYSPRKRPTLPPQSYSSFNPSTWHEACPVGPPLVGPSHPGTPMRGARVWGREGGGRSWPAEDENVTMSD